MESILDAPGVRRAGYQLSVESYHRLGEIGVLGHDVELLEGYLIKKMPKSPLHTYLCQWLLEAIQRLGQAGVIVRQEQPLSTATSEPEPDLAVVRGSLQEFRSRHPTTAELVIEVAISSEEVDFSKAAIYAEAGVKEYWIVEPEKKRVTVFRAPAGRAYGQKVPHEGVVTLASSAVPGLEISLPALFA